MPAVTGSVGDALELLPELMRETGIDCWIVVNREYAEDPVCLTLVPEPVFAARRTTILVFFDRGPEEGVERLTVSRSTAKAHVSNILSKLGVSNRAEAVAMAVQQSLVST